MVQLHEAVDQTSGDRVDPEARSRTGPPGGERDRCQVQQKCQERIELLAAWIDGQERNKRTFIKKRTSGSGMLEGSEEG